MRLFSTMTQDHSYGIKSYLIVWEKKKTRMWFYVSTFLNKPEAFFIFSGT